MNYPGQKESVISLLVEDDDDGAAVDWYGGDGLFAVNGTWDGATASLEWRANSLADWIVLGDSVALEADGGVVFTLPNGQLRCAVADAGTTSLTAFAKRV